MQDEEVKKELQRIYEENAKLINLNPQWIKDQAYLMYENAKLSHDNIAAKQFLELAGKCVGAFKAEPGKDDAEETEPTEPEERRKWLRSELDILEAQDAAGNGLPLIDD